MIIVTTLEDPDNNIALSGPSTFLTRLAVRNLYEGSIPESYCVNACVSILRYSCIPPDKPIPAGFVHPLVKAMLDDKINHVNELTLQVAQFHAATGISYIPFLVVLHKHDKTEWFISSIIKNLSDELEGYKTIVPVKLGDATISLEVQFELTITKTRVLVDCFISEHV